ncbi:MAG: translation initiation factor IF-2 [Clostridiales bacterium]|nr:translation initiation factor IF-2 [Clostridiales bacterium]
MRVSELAKELGKSSREIIDLLRKMNQDVKTHLSNVSDEQVRMVKKSLTSKEPEQVRAAAADAPKKKVIAVYRPQNSQQRPARPRPQNQARPASGRPQTAGSTERPAVRPQAAGSIEKPAVKPQTEGAVERPAAKPQAAGSAERTAARAQAAGSAEKPAARLQTAEGAEKPAARTQTAEGMAAKTQSVPAEAAKSPAVARTEAPQDQTGRSGVQELRRQDNNAGGRDGQRRSGGAQGNRDGQNRTGSYANRDGQGTRDGQRRSGNYQSRDGQNRTGSYQGRDGQNRTGGYQSRDGQGTRDGQRRTGGYQSRDGQGQNRTGGYGNRDGQSQNRTGGYQGTRDGQRHPVGYQGRDGQGQNRTGGYQGSRGGQSRPGGFAGSRPGGQGRPGGRDSGAKSFDTPLQTKPTSSRQVNKNTRKNDRFDRKNVNDDGPRSKSGKVSRHPFIMPQKTAEKKAEDTVKVITVPEMITIKDLAEKMKMQPSVIIKKLFLQGEIVTMNSELSYEKAEEIAVEYDILCEKEEKVDVIAELLKENEENEEDMIPRPPVVCVMGHVDHGKTSLLDAIRSTNVTAREAGGITQHIGAYTVEINGQQITFLDTPGHEAFTAMRMRGAQSTDIAILVVAADDGVMPQTIEAINHAKAANVDIIVAINKIDKPSANIEKVKQELMEYELVPEDWGGNTIFVPVSAHTHEGIPELLEMILLTAEVKELKANPNRMARGLVIEAELDKGKGPVARVLVQKGTLHIGDNVTAGPCYGKVRAMMDDKGRRVKEAGPSMPVEVLGLNGVPGAGDVLIAMENEKDTRSYAETFIAESKNRMLEDTKMKMSLDDLFDQIKAGNVKELPIVVKADVQGSVEAVRSSLLKLSNDEVVVKVIHGGVGAINESDVTLAAASNAIIIGFNVRPDATAKSIADQEKVDMRLYRVIYQAIEDVEAAMKGMLEPVYEEKVIGHAIVRQIFKASSVGTIAGSYVMDGKIQRGCTCRVTRDGEQLFEGALASLKRFKDDVKEVATGYECGLVFEKFNDLQEDDMVEAYIMVEVPRQ